MKFLKDLKKENKKNLNNITNNKGNKIKKNILITVLCILPFISIILVIFCRHIIMPTNEEIVYKVKNLDSYESIIEYTIKNPRGEYIEKANLIYCNEDGIRIDFGEELTKIYTEDKIIMDYKNKNERYEVDRDLDNFYTLAVLKEIFNNEIVNLEEDNAEWGDLKYLMVSFDLAGNNNHLNKAKLYIDKKKIEPLLIKIYDNKGEERVKIEYREFNKRKNCKEEDFAKYKEVMEDERH